MIAGKPYVALAGEVIRVHEVTHDVRLADGHIVTLPTYLVRPPYVGQVVGVCLFEPDAEAFGLAEEKSHGS